MASFWKNYDSCINRISTAWKVTILLCRRNSLHPYHPILGSPTTNKKEKVSLTLNGVAQLPSGDKKDTPPHPITLLLKVL